MPQDIMEASDNQRAVTDWLINYDKDYKNKEIWADDWSGIAFNLWMDVNNTASYKNQSNFTTVLLKNNVDYYIAEGKNENISSEHYKIIKEEGNIVLYKRIWGVIMRILHVVPSFVPCLAAGGVVKASYQIAKKQVELGQ